MGMIPFNKPYIIGKELFYIASAVIENTHLAGDGKFTKRCQKWLEDNLGSGKALLTHSCTGALEMGAILADIKPGDEVIMPSYTFVSTANAFVLRGGVPVFIDIRPDTLNIDESLIEAAITPLTKAIVPVHYAGKACEMDVIMQLADKYRLWVIEDAAQALLSEYKGKKLGTIGHLGALSFHETKNVISGEGGALLINDLSLTERSEIIWEKGTNRKKFFRGEVDKYTWVDIGSSYLPSEVTAAFLYAQLENADSINRWRKDVAVKYYQSLKQLSDEGKIELQTLDDDANGHIFYVIVSSAEEKYRLLEHMKVRDIKAVFHYVPLHSSPAGMRFGRTGSIMKNTDEYSARLLRLPLYYGMADDAIRTVVDSIYEFYGRKA